MVDKYSVTQYPVNVILGFIEAGDIAIPEIQRPFVWKASQVRDLIDSLYCGYPTGYLIIWQNPTVRLKDGKDAVGKKILIDGQQRVTAIMTAIGGHKVLTDDYKEKVVKIAFNPLAKEDEERFAVQTPAHLKSSHWIPDISEMFKPNFNSFGFVLEYQKKNPDADPFEINKAIEKLVGIKNCQLGVISLVPELDINEVTEIFVRINSRGKRLNEADFAMSKIAADDRYGGRELRKAIDYFCHVASDPSFYQRITEADEEFKSSHFATKIKWLKNDNDDIYDPTYSDMLRVSFMHLFNRGKLGVLVSLLSGRDFDDRTFKEEKAKESFEKLSIGVENFINEYNFKNFILAIKSAGFVSQKLLSSRMTIDFAYTLFLLLQNSSEIKKIEIKRYIQKWFVLSTLTGRYASSPETQMDKDLRAISTKGFLQFFKEAEEANLGETFWNVRLVQNLDTASINSPAFSTYLAAQIFFNDRSLLSSSTTVSHLINTGDVHHIFPKKYLQQNGLDERSLYNQVANYTYLDSTVNIAIGKKAPTEYFTEALKQCKDGKARVGLILNEDDFWANLKANCVPKSVLNMKAEDYTEFLNERRKLMAQKIRSYYESL